MCSIVFTYLDPQNPQRTDKQKSKNWTTAPQPQADSAPPPEGNEVKALAETPRQRDPHRVSTIQGGFWISQPSTVCRIVY